MTNDTILINESERELEEYKYRNFQTRINTMLPCVVTGVESNRVSIQLNILREFGTVTQNPLVLSDVPVIFPGTGENTVRFPINVGDTGLALFAQRDIDNWLLGQVAKPRTTRLHDINDAVYLPGLRKSDDVSIPENMEITSGNIKITFSQSGQMKIENGQFDFMQLVTDLATALSTATSSPSGGPLSSNVQVTQILAKLGTFNGT